MDQLVHMLQQGWALMAQCRQCVYDDVLKLEPNNAGNACLKTTSIINSLLDHLFLKYLLVNMTKVQHQIARY